MDLVLTLVTVEQLTEINRKCSENEEWCTYNYDEGKIMGLALEPVLTCRTASDAEMRKGGQPKAIWSYRE